MAASPARLAVAAVLLMQHNMADSNAFRRYRALSARSWCVSCDGHFSDECRSFALGDFKAMRPESAAIPNKPGETFPSAQESTARGHSRCPLISH